MNQISMEKQFIWMSVDFFCRKKEGWNDSGLFFLLSCLEWLTNSWEWMKRRQLQKNVLTQALIKFLLWDKFLVQRLNSSLFFFAVYRVVIEWWMKMSVKNVSQLLWQFFLHLFHYVDGRFWTNKCEKNS